MPLGLRMEVNSSPKKVPKPNSRLTVGDESCAKVTIQRFTTYFLSSRVTDETSYQAPNSGMADSSADCLDSAINALMVNQVYGVTTFDSTFKYVMRDADVCLEFVKTFARLEQAQGVTLLDDSMNPIKELTAAREFLDSQENLKFMQQVRSGRVEMVVGGRGNKYVGSFLTGLSKVYDDIRNCFPAPEKDSRMDLVCRIEGGNYVLVEVQVQNDDHWDSRALAYAAGFYGNQLKRGGKWKNLKQVVAVNILGKGTDESDPWRDCPEEIFRHYQFTDVINDRDPKHSIQGLQLIQYCVPHLDKTSNETLKEWATFFQKAYQMSEAEVKKVKSSAVRKAYERAHVRNMPREVKQSYLQDAAKYGGYSKELERVRRETAERVGKETAELVRRETTKEIIISMLAAGMSEAQIASIVKKTEVEIRSIRASGCF